MAGADQGLMFPMPFLGTFVETAAFAMATPLRIFAMNAALARNFHQAFVIPLRDGDANGTTQQERQSVIDVERDGRTGVDLKFGSISFKEEAKGTFAVALVDVIVGATNDEGTRVQMSVKVAADPAADYILDVTERCRDHIVATLRGAADTLAATSGRALLFEGVSGQ